MTDDEIRDAYRKVFAAHAAVMKNYQAAMTDENKPWIWGNFVSDSGDETSPSECNPQPIDSVYVKVESEEERNERMWRAVQAAAQG